MKLIEQYTDVSDAGATVEHTRAGRAYGIELDGIDEAHQFAGQLLAYATLRLANPFKTMDMQGWTMEQAGLEALELQARLLQDITSGRIADAPFGFRATHNMSERVIRGAFQLTPEQVREEAERKPHHFRTEVTFYPLFNYVELDLGDDQKRHPEENIKSNADLAFLDPVSQTIVPNSYKTKKSIEKPFSRSSLYDN